MFPSAIILLFSGFFRDFAGSEVQLQSLGYLSILSVAGTALAMLLYFRLIKITSAVFASMVAYLLPIVAVFWGILAGESFNIWYALGGLLILAGIYMVQEKNVDEIISEIPGAQA
jgi:drug/metabolite transporter (DMT)-like permease